VTSHPDTEFNRCNEGSIESGERSLLTDNLTSSCNTMTLPSRSIARDEKVLTT